MSKTFAADIEEAAGGEHIEGIIVGSMWKYSEPDQHDIPVELQNKVLNWDEVREHLNYAYDTSYGCADCPPIHAWTKLRVLFVGHYDGSTWVQAIPRNPMDIIPELYGGG